MPELPQVQTVVRDLRPRLIGRKVTGLRAVRRKLRHPWKPTWTKRIVGPHVAGLRRRGKWIIVDFDNGTHLLVHLGMTGRFTVELETAELAPHTHLIFSLDRSEEHTSELQSLRHLVCRLLLEKKKQTV